MLIHLRYSLGLLLLFFVTSVFADVAVPSLSKRVTDLTATLTSEQNTALENKIAAFEAKKGSQIAVLILPTTQPETIEAFGIRVADTWKIGRKGIDDGVILIVAKNDRKLRIEVGRGLEGAIPDAVAKRVIAEIITPYFKNNDFADGIDAGVSQLIKLIDGELLPAAAPSSTGNANISGWIAMFILFYLPIIVLVSLFFSRFGNTTAMFLTGLTASAISSGYVFIVSFDFFKTIGTAIIMFFFGSIVSRFVTNHSAFSINRRSVSFWGSGGRSSRTSGSSSSWSGSGGSFSGGGASGSW